MISQPGHVPRLRVRAPVTNGRVYECVFIFPFDFLEMFHKRSADCGVGPSDGRRRRCGRIRSEQWLEAFEPANQPAAYFMANAFRRRRTFILFRDSLPQRIARPRRLRGARVYIRREREMRVRNVANPADFPSYRRFPFYFSSDRLMISRRSSSTFPLSRTSPGGTYGRTSVPSDTLYSPREIATEIESAAVKG